MLSESELTYLHKIYSEICCSHSIYELNGNSIYIKHRSLQDDLLTDTLYTNELNKLKQNKIFTEQEKLDYLIKKANRLGKNGRDVICVFEQEDEEGTHLFFEVTGFKPKAPIQC